MATGCVTTCFAKADDHLRRGPWANGEGLGILQRARRTAAVIVDYIAIIALFACFFEAVAEEESSPSLMVWVK